MAFMLKGVVDMTKFEMIGVNYQYDAATVEEANKCFMHSCNICCHRGIHIECDNCAIACVHNMVVASFENRRVNHENPKSVGDNL